MYPWFPSVHSVVQLLARGVAQAALFSLLVAPVAAADAPMAPRPNILVILTDDQGYGDLSVNGATDLQTPNMDRLFAEGMSFKNFRTNSCVCSPTRAALLTGRYPERVGVPGVIRTQPANSWGYLDPAAQLLPQSLRPAGYDSAIIGKWHLGLDPADAPNARGFDFFHGFLGDMMDDYVTHRRHGQNYLRRNEEVIESPLHATDLFAGWACEYLRERATRPDAPFFLYLAFNAPHDPIQPPAPALERVRQRAPQLPERRAKLVALIEHLDEAIGRVLATLDETGLAKNTLVVFTSDNGGLLPMAANNRPWRDGKGSMYEGGLRVPFAARWPGRIAPGSRSEVPALTMDIFPTALAAAGLAPAKSVDGTSLLPALLGQVAEAATPPRDLFFIRREGGKPFGGKEIEAVIRGRWKLLQNSPWGPRELYDLTNDSTETRDLAASEPETVTALSNALALHRQRGGAVPWQKPR